MLDTLRKSTGSWVIKILFGLLILSFGIWGVGDMVNSVGRDQAAVTVGDVEVSAAEVKSEFETELDRLSKMLGDTVRTNDFMRQSVLGSVVRRLADKAALEMAARDLDVTVNDADLAAYIAKIPAFQDEKGAFDRNRYLAALSRASLSQARFEDMIRGEFRRVQILDTIAAGTVAPRPMTEIALHLQADTRTAWAVTVDATAMPRPAAPDEAALTQYYETRKDSFTAPEFRAVTALTLTADDARDRIAVTDADLQAAYDQRIDDFRVPASRAVVQLPIEDKATADKAGALIAKGLSFDALAAELGIAPVALGAVAKRDLPADAADAVYALPVGGVTAPLASALGWHVFSVTAETPESLTPLADVRDRLSETLIKERSVDAVYKLSAELDDAIGGGASIEEAAKTLNLKVQKFPALDAQGKDRAGQSLTGIAANKEFVAAAFRSDIGLESALTEFADGFFMLRVDEVIEPAVRPLDEVRAEVVAMWQGDMVNAEAKKRADALAERLKSGAAPQSLGARLTAPFTRQGDPKAALPVPANLAQKLFAQSIGGVEVSGTDTGFIVAKVAAETKADPASAAPALKDISASLADALSQDLAVQLLNAVGTRYGIDVNQGVIEGAIR